MKTSFKPQGGYSSVTYRVTFSSSGNWTTPNPRSKSCVIEHCSNCSLMVGLASLQKGNSNGCKGKQRTYPSQRRSRCCIIWVRWKRRIWSGWQTEATVLSRVTIVWMRRELRTWLLSHLYSESYAQKGRHSQSKNCTLWLRTTRCKPLPRY